MISMIHIISHLYCWSPRSNWWKG